MRRGILFTLVSAVTGLLLATGAAPTQGEPGPHAPDEILVKFHPGVPEELIAALNAAMRADVIERIEQLGIVRLRVPEESLEAVLNAYERHPNVEFAELNYIATVADTIPNDPWFANWQYGPQYIQAPKAWDTTTGTSAVVIAVVDTGADYTHPDLVAKLLPGYDFANGDNNPQDDHGHGTHVAGIAAASSNNGEGVASICWGCLVLPVKVLDKSGSGSYASVASGITYAADHGAAVINLSLGGPSNSNSLKSAVDYAYGKGAVLVAAAGNDGGSVLYPAAYPNVLAVAATDSSDVVTSWSNHGSEIDVAAPGEGIISTQLGGDYNFMSGTSMSTPFVSGSVALLLAFNPSLSNSQAIAALEQGADDKGAAGWDQYSGWGRINVYRALQLAGAPPSLTPTVVPTPTPTPTPIASATPTPTPTATPTPTVTPTPTPTPTSILTPTPQPKDSAPPSVTLLRPSAGQSVWGRVDLEASAWDDRGVTKVSFYMDGKLVRSVSSPPYITAWNSRSVKAGEHLLTARAYDAAGNWAEDSHTVVVPP